MGSINYANPNKDQTVKIFDRFYLYEVDVPAPEYDAVYSFFRSVYDTDQAAGNFTEWYSCYDFTRTNARP